MNIKSSIGLKIFLGLVLLLIVLPVEKGFAKEARHYVALAPQGEVYIQKTNSVKRLYVTHGMHIEQGDRIITGKNSSVSLIAPDTNDQLTVLQNSMIFFDELYTDEKHYTYIDVVSGNVAVHVTPINETGDFFYVTIDNVPVQIKGTSFLIGINPASGESLLTLLSGLVTIQGTTGNQTTLIYPTQQINFSPLSGSDSQLSPIQITDLSKFINSLDANLIEQILKGKSDIDRENAEMLKKLQESLEPNLGSQLSERDIDQYNTNVETLLNSLLSAALINNSISEDEFKKLKEQISSELNKNTIQNTLNEQQQQQELLRKEQEEALKIQNALLKQQKLKEQQEKAQLLAKLEKEKQALEEKKKQEALALEQERLKQELEAKKKQEEERLLALQQAIEAQRQREEQLKLQAEITNLKEQKTLLEAELAPLQLQKSNLLANIVDFELLRDELLSIQQQTEDSNAQLKQAKDNYEQDSPLYEQCINTLTGKIEQQLITIEALNSQIKQLQARLNEEDVEQIEEGSQSVGHLQQRLASNMLMAAFTPQQERDSLLADISNLQQLKLTLPTEIAELEQRLASLVETYGNVALLQAELTKAKQLLEEVNEQLASENALTAELEHRIAALESEKSANDELIVELRLTLTTLQQQLQETEDAPITD